MLVVRSVAPPERLSDHLAQVILAKAEGNPFFLEELTRAVVEQGELQADVAVPDTIQGVLMARIDRLPDAAKRLLQTASVLGREFSLRLLETLWEGPGAVEPLLGELKRLEFVYEHPGAEEPVYVFKHVLTQEVAYGSLLHERRRALHARIVAAIETLSADRLADQVEQLARHAFWGEVWDKAVAYYWQAGAKAVARSAYREAVAAFEQALEVVQHLPKSHDTQAQVIDLRLALRNALWPLGELERNLVSLQDAYARAETLGDQHRLGWVAAHLLAHFVHVCDLDRALAFGQRALTIAADLGEAGLTVTVQGYLGIVYRSLGDYPQAVECFRKNVACLPGELLQERFGLHTPPAVLSRSFLVLSLAECGAFAEGQAPAEEGVRIAEAANHPFSRVHAYWAVGFRLLRQGDALQAIPVLERGLDIAQEAHIRLAAPWVAATLGAAYTLARRTAEALPLLEQAIAQAVAMRYMVDYALRVVWLGEAYLCAGRLDEASTQAQRALEFARGHQERGHEAYALWLLGEIHARHDPPAVESVETHYRQALTLAEALGMRPLQAHCHLGLSTLYTAQGQPEQARAALSAAMALYRAMDMTYWLPQAAAALRHKSV